MVKVKIYHCAIDEGCVEEISFDEETGKPLTKHTFSIYKDEESGEEFAVSPKIKRVFKAVIKEMSDEKKGNK